MSAKWLLLAMMLGALLCESVYACGGGSGGGGKSGKDDGSNNGDNGDNGDKGKGDDGSKGDENNGQIEGEPCPAGDDLKPKMEEIMGKAGSPKEAADSIRTALEEKFSSEKFNVICASNDFAFRNYYKKPYLCKKNNVNNIWCLAYAD